MPTIDSGDGVNTLTYSGSWSTAVTVDLKSTSGFQVINGPSDVLNTLIGNDLGNTWNITGKDSGTLENTTYSSPVLTFSNFPNLTGGSEEDTFIFGGEYQVSGQIDGGGGENTVTGPDETNTWAITADNTGSLTPGSAEATMLSHIQNFIGGSLSDTFDFIGAYLLEGETGVDGGGGDKTIDLSLGGNTWYVVGHNEGRLSPDEVSGSTHFINIPSIKGGPGKNDIIFQSGGFLDDGVDGGLGEDSVTGPDVETSWVISKNNGGVDYLWWKYYKSYKYSKILWR